MYVLAIIFPIIFFVGLAGYIQFGLIQVSSEDSNFAVNSTATLSAASSYWEKAQIKAVELKLVEQPELWKFDATNRVHIRILIQTLALLALDASSNPSESSSQLPPSIQELCTMQSYIINELPDRVQDNGQAFYYAPKDTSEPIVNVTIGSVYVSSNPKRSFITIEGKRFYIGNMLPDDQGKITKIEKDSITVLVGKKEVKVKIKK